MLDYCYKSISSSCLLLQGTSLGQSPAMLMLVKSLATEIFPIAGMLGTASWDDHSVLHFSLFVLKHHQVASNFKQCIFTSWSPFSSVLVCCLFYKLYYDLGLIRPLQACHSGFLSKQQRNPAFQKVVCLSLRPTEQPLPQSNLFISIHLQKVWRTTLDCVPIYLAVGMTPP